jgi:hypothetical protein
MEKRTLPLYRRKRTDYNENMKFRREDGTYAWDRNRLLNIWVCNIGEGDFGLFGFATYPGGVDEEKEQQMVSSSTSQPSGQLERPKSHLISAVLPRMKLGIGSTSAIYGPTARAKTWSTIHLLATRVVESLFSPRLPGVLENGATTDQMEICS